MAENTNLRVLLAGANNMDAQWLIVRKALSLPLRAADKTDLERTDKQQSVAGRLKEAARRAESQPVKQASQGGQER